MMDYSSMLTQITNNQSEIILLLTNIDKGIFTILSLVGIFLIYLFIRNMLKRG